MICRSIYTNYVGIRYTVYMLCIRHKFKIVVFFQIKFTCQYEYSPDCFIGVYKSIHNLCRTDIQAWLGSKSLDTYRITFKMKNHSFPMIVNLRWITPVSSREEPLYYLKIIKNKIKFRKEPLEDSLVILATMYVFTMW